MVPRVLCRDAGGYLMEALDDIGMRRVAARMKAIDRLSPELRAMVHEHGWTIINGFLEVGVTKPKHIRHLISIVRAGAIEIGNRTVTEAMRLEYDRRMAGALRGAGWTVIEPNSIKNKPEDEE